MRTIEIVENYEEAMNKAALMGLDVTHLDPDAAIMTVNSFLVMDEITVPVRPVDISVLKEHDLLSLKDDITLDIEEYRIVKILEENFRKYLVLVKVSEENETEHNLYFYGFEESQHELIILTEEEWPLVEKLYDLALQEPAIDLQLV
ncbi:MULTISPECIES: hypothetical protein [unclassified Paenibacillus]|uniref:hypothetical protein n=1 Tax=unclassified Paenibacillus TaxID=185978 RepID=UPI0009A60E4A|nr:MULTISPECIES: hypothetical protein [unclassified Paenibacillus]SLK16015.1 hypothetical protein SAMN06272722_11057 [Paenibacillus sp. RU5A]SOC74170.1 hypothetical protein SAMN05880581_11057 [Paenibacillus sp. RU26A]SOC76320.1 hypothetical protein SAMN05880586_11057 [Paenibacillus sp. RU5M]